MRRSSLCLLAALAITSAACQPPQVRQAPDGESYVHADYPLRVGYRHSWVTAPGADWRLDNYSFDDAKPDQTKEGDFYTSTRRFDTDDDGVTDFEEEQPAFDLRYEHRQNAGVIWMHAVPVSTSLRAMSLRVMGRDLVDDTTSRVETIELSRDNGRAVIQRTEGRTTAFAVAESACTLGAAEAYRIDYETADVERARLDPSYRKRRARMIMVRTGLSYTPGASLRRAAKARREYPVLLLLVYANRPEDFNAGLPDFERFVQDIGLGAPGAGPPAHPSGLTCTDMKQLDSVPPASFPTLPPVPASPAISAPPASSTSPSSSATDPDWPWSDTPPASK